MKPSRQQLGDNEALQQFKVKGLWWKLYFCTCLKSLPVYQALDIFVSSIKGKNLCIRDAEQSVLFKV